MISHLTQADEDYSRRVREGLAMTMAAITDKYHTGTHASDPLVDRNSNKSSNTDG